MKHGSHGRSFTKEECDSLITLLDSGFSFRDALRLLDDTHMHPIVMDLLGNMEAGNDVGKYLSAYLPMDYRFCFGVFIHYMSLSTALKASRTIVRQKETERNEMVGKLVYPILLGIGMCIGLLVFNLVVFPSMLRMADGFDVDLHLYIVLQQIISFLDVCIMVASVICTVVCVICLHRTNIVSTYRFLIDRFPENLLVQQASRDFAFFFVSCLENGMATRDTMHILMDLKGYPLVSHIALQLDWLMEKGEGMMEAMKIAGVEEALLRFFSTAVQSSSCRQMMHGYLQMSEIRTKRRIQRFALSVQLVSYIAVGVVIVVVYQVLMLPMQMLGTL